MIKSGIMLEPKTGKAFIYKKGSLVECKYDTSDGYCRVRLNGMRFYVHHLMWMSFNGAIPLRHVVHHINGDKLDNRKDNLELMLDSEHRSQHTRGELNPRAKLTNKDITQIKRQRSLGIPVKKIALQFDVTPRCLYYLLEGKTWSNSSH
jgi:hypothetical protein